MRRLIRPLLLTLLVGVACGRPDGHDDLRGLDSEVLAAFDRLFAPLPRFTGSPGGKARFLPVEGGGCPPALERVRLVPGEGQRREAQRLARRVERMPTALAATPAALRLRALWSLISDPTAEGRSRTVRLLQAALAKEPASLSRRNDLAAADLLRASLDGPAGDFAEALELTDLDKADSDRADRGRQVAVALNRAYALQCLTLWRAAEDTWRGLPAGTADQLPAAGPQRSDLRHGRSGDPLLLRRRGEWLLGEWGTRAMHGETVEANHVLSEAAAIGSQLAASGGDALLNASARVILAAETKKDRATLLALARGHAAFHSVRGDAIYSACRPAVLRSANAELTRAGSPFALWVRLDEAVCAYYDQDYLRADKILGDLESAARQQGWPALAARSEWMLGLIDIVQARFVESDRHYSRAIEIYTRLGEEAHVVYLHTLRATLYEYGGAQATAWHERLAALKGRAVCDPERRFSILFEAVDAMRAHAYPAAALHFLDEQMRAAEAAAQATGQTDLLAFTLLARSRLLADLGRRAESAAAVADAEAAWSRLPANNGNRRQLRVEIDLQRTLSQGAASPQSVLAAIDNARSFFAGRGGSPGEQMEVLKLDRLQAHVDEARGDAAAARADLLRGAREVERQRLKLAPMADRAEFLAQWRGLFLDLVRLEIDSFHDPLAALAAFERSSNRVFGDSSGAWFAATAELLQSKTSQLSFPPDLLVVRFGHLQDRLLLWSFHGGRMEFEQRFIHSTELSRQIGYCRDLLAKGTAEVQPEAACQLLARNLLPRSLESLPDGSAVLLVPDEIVAPLSFAALRTDPAAPPLIARFRLSYAPSLTLLLSLERGSLPPTSAPPRTVLFVSDPAFSLDLYSSLPRLPAATPAARGYATHYHHPTFLSGPRATLPAVLGALAGVEVLQFDGHGLTNPQYPERGGLLLAPADNQVTPTSSVLTAADLPPGLPGRLRLVILGACSTGLTTYRDTAEVTGLAAAFLARGVPEVIGTAWPVQNEAAAELLDHFHRAFSAGQPADVALQAAQVACASKGHGGIGSCAAFQLFRGGKILTRSVSKASPM